MMRLAKWVGMAMAIFGPSIGASARVEAGQVLSYTIQDIGNFTDYQTPNTGQTFQGTGFVGIYSFGYFGHLFGLESGFSATAMQVNIGNLAGADVLSAYLSFSILDGPTAPQTITATSYTSNGNLGYYWNTPDILGTQNYAGIGRGSNSLDVTALLKDRVDAGAGWFGLQLKGSSSQQWTYTYSDYGYSSDRALVRLNVEVADTAAIATPEPSTIALAAAGMPIGLICWLRRRNARAAA